MCFTISMVLFKILLLGLSSDYKLKGKELILTLSWYDLEICHFISGSWESKAISLKWASTPSKCRTYALDCSPQGLRPMGMASSLLSPSVPLVTILREETHLWWAKSPCQEPVISCSVSQNTQLCSESWHEPAQGISVAGNQSATWVTGSEGLERSWPQLKIMKSLGHRRQTYVRTVSTQSQ